MRSSLIALIIAAFATGCSTGKQQDTFPNIILILADDMGYGDISGLNPGGRIPTPSIDKLIHEGIAFTNAHAGASVCTPSRYGLLTGRYAFRSDEAAHGIWGFNQPVINTGTETLATVLSSAGYTTACIGKWHLGLSWKTRDGTGHAELDKRTGYSNTNYEKAVTGGPNDHGFDYSFILPASLDIPPYVFLRNQKVTDPEVILTTDVYPRRLESTEFAWDKKHTDDLAVYWEKGVWWRQGEMSESFRIENCQLTILNEGVAFIEQHLNANPEKPFFLYLPLTGPHTPWVPDEKFKGKSPIGLYGDFVMETDHTVHTIMEVLSSNRIEENTILIFASDNGAYWPDTEINLHNHDSNHGRRGQKGDVWEGGHRIPLIISWPGTIDKSRCSQLISFTDFFATLSELTRSAVNDQQGEDSFSFLDILYGTSDRSSRTSMVHHSSKDMFGIRKGSWKYIDGLGSGGFTDPDFYEAEPGEAPGQLYNLEDDPGETENLYLKHPGKVAELQQSLTSIREQH